MRIESKLTDAGVLQEFGERLERRRIDAGLTQAQLADEAGVSKRTVERMEAGNSTDFTLILRVLRVLKLLEGLDQLVPDAPLSPMTLLKSRGRVRKRVGSPRKPTDEAAGSRSSKPWKWGE